jgi:hypothetical protein
MEAPIKSTPDAVEWLTPQDAMRIFRISKTKFYFWAANKAFPTYRPRLPNEKETTRTTLVKRAEVQAFIESGRSV